MPLRSLASQLEKARILLDRLKDEPEALSESGSQKAEEELARFIRSIEGCLQAGKTFECQPEGQALDNARGEGPFQEHSATWLTDSISEVRAGTWRWHFDSGKMDWSPEMYQLHGYRSALEPMEFDCYAELIHPDDRDRVIQKMNSSREFGTAFVDEYRIVSTNGTILWVNTVAEAERDASGKPIFLGGISQDVTDRKLAEENLREAKEREKARAAELEAILDTVPALVWISRDPECREMTGSRYGYEFLEMWKGANLSKTAPTTELQLQKYRNFKDGREIPGNELPMQLAAATGIPTRNYEFDIVFNDGRSRTLLGNAMPLLNQEGKPIGAVGAFIDITDRKNIEKEHLENEALERSRSAQLQAVIDAVPTPVFLAFDPEGHTITGNRAAYRVMQAEPGANFSRVQTGRSETPVIKVVYQDKELPPQEAPMIRALQSGKPIDDFELQLVFEDGKQVSLWGSASPLLDESGKVYGSVGSFMDVTSRREAESVLRRHAERDAYRIALADAIRRLTDPEQIKETAAQMLGRRLKASRVFYVTVEPGGEEVTLGGGYTDGVQELKGRFLLADFSRNLPKDHPNGLPYIITDIPHDSKLTEAQRTAYLALDVQAHVDLPLIIDGQFQALLAVHQSTPRQWTEEELALIIETAERTWASVERARAEAALRESQARFHASIESLLESFILYSAVRKTRKDGKPGEIIDLRFEYVNAAACRINQKTREQMLGHTLLEVLAGPVGNELFRLYKKVLRTGAPVMGRIPLGENTGAVRVFDIHAVKLGDGLVVTRADVTEQVRSENERQRAITQVEIHQRLSDQSERDRQSYAREVHDGPIQSLASIAYNIQYLKEVFPDPVLTSELGQISSIVRNTIRDLRQLISNLRPPAVLRFGLTKAIEIQAEETSGNMPGIQWNYRLAEDDNRLPVPTRLTLFRIYQEAVNNIIRHSQATRAWIRLQIRSEDVVLIIRDNGKGLPEKHDYDTLTLNDHFGLAGMKERAEVIGGKLEITSNPGKGTRIRVVAPLIGKGPVKGLVPPGQG